MVKNHLKRLALPKTWQVKRKGVKFVTKPNPGPHSIKLSIPLNIIFRDILGYAQNNREVKNILENKAVMVDGIRRKELKFPTGVFDSIEIPGIKDCFRIILNKKCKIDLIKIDKKEVNVKPCKIISKSKVKGKTQLNLYDGKNILVEKDDFKVGDTLLIKVPKQEIIKHVKLEKNVMVYFTGGKYVGSLGKIEDIRSDKISCKVNGEVVETLKKYAFVIGEDKEFISILGKDKD